MDKPQRVIARRILLNVRNPLQARQSCLWDFHQDLEEFPQQGLSHLDT